MSVYNILYESTDLPSDIIKSILNYTTCVISDCNSFGTHLLNYENNLGYIAIELNIELDQYYCKTCFQFVVSEIENYEVENYDDYDYVIDDNEPEESDGNIINRFIINEDSYESLYNYTDLPEDIINLINDFNKCMKCNNQGIIKLYADANEVVAKKLNIDNLCFYCNTCHNVILDTFINYWCDDKWLE